LDTLGRKLFGLLADLDNRGPDSRGTAVISF